MGNCCSSSPPTIYQKVGGQGAVDALVPLFYGKLTRDPLLEPVFRPFDVESLMEHQRTFIAFALGGPNNYVGRPVRRAHQRVNNGKFPTEAMFTRSAELLIESLKELGVGQDLIDEIVAVVATTKDDVCGL